MLTALPHHGVSSRAIHGVNRRVTSWSQQPCYIVESTAVLHRGVNSRVISCCQKPCHIVESAACDEQGLRPAEQLADPLPELTAHKAVDERVDDGVHYEQVE